MGRGTRYKNPGRADSLTQQRHCRTTGPEQSMSGRQSVMQRLGEAGCMRVCGWGGGWHARVAREGGDRGAPLYRFRPKRYFCVVLLPPPPRLRVHPHGQQRYPQKVHRTLSSIRAIRKNDIGCVSAGCVGHAHVTRCVSNYQHIPPTVLPVG